MGCLFYWGYGLASVGAPPDFLSIEVLERYLGQKERPVSGPCSLMTKIAGSTYGSLVESDTLTALLFCSFNSCMIKSVIIDALTRSSAFSLARSIRSTHLFSLSWCVTKHEKKVITSHIMNLCLKDSFPSACVSKPTPSKTRMITIIIGIIPPLASHKSTNHESYYCNLLLIAHSHILVYI